MKYMSELRDSFIFYRDWREALKKLPDKEKVEIYDAIVDYGLDGIEKALSPIADVVMSLIKPQIIRDRDKYLQFLEKQRVNGAKGGRPSKNPTVSDENPKNPSLSEKPMGYSENPKNPTVSGLKPKNPNYVNDNVNDNVNENNNLDNISSVRTDLIEREIEEVVEFYNQTCTTCKLPKCMKLSDKRKGQIRARLRESGKEKIFEAITIASQSEFMNGMNDTGWRADIEFITNANKFLLILEGRYSHKSNGNNNNGSNSERAVEVGRKAIESILNDDDI